MTDIAPDTLQRFTASIFTAAGLSASDADCVANLLVWADRRGVASHGVVRAPRYLELITDGEMNPAARTQLHSLAPAVFRLDALGVPGPVAMIQAIDHAIGVTRAQGTCFGVVAGCTHTGAIGAYVERAARQGFAAVVTASGPINMAYHGAAVASLSTSPLAIGVPGEPAGAPLVLDMATANVAMGRLKQMVADHQPLPEGWALAADGTPTTDPARAEITMPVGGAKGSGLSLMFECLSGLLAAAPLLAGQLDGSDLRHRQNAFVIVIDIEVFRPVAEFRADVARLAGLIRALPRREGFDALLLPGERGGRIAAQRRSAIPLAAKSWQALLDAAVRLGVPAPSV